MKRRNVFACLLICLISGFGAVSPARAGPLSEMYLTGYRQGEPSSVFVVQGGQVARSWPANTATYEFAIAVRNTVRTLGIRPGNIGSEYSLQGVFTGVHYPYTNSVNMDLPDGTVGGLYNYAVGYFDGTVYRFDGDWGNPTALFTLGCCWGAITFDSDTNSLWLGGSDGAAAGRIENRSLDGSLLNSFAIDGSPMQSFALGLDPADHTLWVSRTKKGAGFSQTPRLEQYSKGGQWLNTQEYPALNGVVINGGDFATSIASVDPTAFGIDPHGTYGPCGPGAGLRGKLETVVAAGQVAGWVSAIAVLDCHAYDGPGGAQVIPCPTVPGRPYSFCVESKNDGVGNHVVLGVVKANAAKTNPLGTYSCGADSRVKAELVTETGKDLRQVNGIVLIRCSHDDGSGGSHIVSCPAGHHPYAYCIENANDGEGNHVLLGVVASNRESDPFALYGNCNGDTGYRVKSSLLMDAGKTLGSVNGIDILSCTGWSGSGGSVVVPCATGTPYAYCLQNTNDGEGNNIRVGVILR